LWSRNLVVETLNLNNYSVFPYSKRHFCIRVWPMQQCHNNDVPSTLDAPAIGKSQQLLDWHRHCNNRVIKERRKWEFCFFTIVSTTACFSLTNSPILARNHHIALLIQHHNHGNHI
jgi:hypothetical protein